MSPRRSVVLAIDSLEGGGAQRQIVALANCLHERGFGVTIVTHYAGDQLSHLLVSEEIRRIRVPRQSRRDVLFLFRLYRFLRRERPDCVVSYLTTTNMFARVAGRLAGIRRIITSERSANVERGPAAVWRERLLARWSDAIVVNSHEGRRNLLQQGMPADKVRVIYNGLDTGLFRRQGEADARAFRASLGVADGHCLVLLPGRVSAEKNHLLLVKAVLDIDPQGARFRVIFAGNEFYPDVKRAIVERIEAAHATERFRFLGPRHDMPLLYSAADVVVLPSRWEGFPNVLVEAMACGTPVIASRVSDNPQIVAPGETGFLFDSEDEAGLAAALQSVLALGAAGRAAMGRKGVERASRLCSMKAFGDSYCALIEGRA